VTDAIEEGIRRFLIEDLHRGNGDVAIDEPLIERGVLDSLGIMHLVTFVESEYGVTIDDEDLVPEHFGTIGAVARLVEGKRRPSDAS
jgi:acyl carrier protein